MLLFFFVSVVYITYARPSGVLLGTVSSNKEIVFSLSETTTKSGRKEVTTIGAGIVDGGASSKRCPLRSAYIGTLMTLSERELQILFKTESCLHVYLP